ncbi:MAG: DUF3156 family protein [Bacillota bacterium]
MDFINKKAFGHFKNVVNLICNENNVQKYFVDNEIKAKIKFVHCDFDIICRYKIQNKVMGRVYDFILETKLKNFYDEEIDIELKYNGFFNIKGAYFSVKKGSVTAKNLVQKLNTNKHLLDNIVKLKFQQFFIKSDSKTGVINITGNTLIGSTVWFLIPPVFYTIRPTSEESQLITELYKNITSILI